LLDAINGAIMKAIVIREPYVSLILDGKKTWEMRSTRANYRGRVGLIKQGSGHLVGIAELVDCLPPLTAANYAEQEAFHCVAPADQPGAVKSKWIYPWVMKGAQRLSRPVPYKHKAGAVVWVSLDDDIVRRVLEQIGEAV
jgi:hypothetical protein